MPQPESLSDLDVYRRLCEAAETLEDLAAVAASLVGATAAKTAAHSVRGMAQAVYEHAIDEGPAH